MVKQAIVVLALAAVVLLFLAWRSFNKIGRLAEKERNKIMKAYENVNEKGEVQEDEHI